MLPTAVEVNNDGQWEVMPSPSRLV